MLLYYQFRFIESHGAELIVANHEKMSPNQELIEDLLAVVHSFSCRLDGIRKYKKQINELIQATE